MPRLLAVDADDPMPMQAQHILSRETESGREKQYPQMQSSHPFDPSTRPGTMKEEEDAEASVHASIAISADDEYDDAEHGGSDDGKSGDTSTSATACSPNASPLPSIPFRNTSIVRVLFPPPPLLSSLLRRGRLESAPFANGHFQCRRHARRKRTRRKMWRARSWGIRAMCTLGVGARRDAHDLVAVDPRRGLCARGGWGVVVGGRALDLQLRGSKGEEREEDEGGRECQESLGLQGVMKKIEQKAERKGGADDGGLIERQVD
ncbi:hypothetical protein C8J57DRAFT_1232551 [Mycena rebaudengoi]|nr:hypothetical protein C8J57DRAFT_1232551 [Mycena rebaudengoi]